jgi:hypothetical protein
MKRVVIKYPNNTEQIQKSAAEASRTLGITEVTMTTSLRKGRLGHTNIKIEYIEDEQDINK